jgi:hypothetical protein
LREKVDLLFDQLKTQIFNQMDDELNDLEIYQTYKSMKNLQRQWINSKQKSDLKKFVRTIDNFLEENRKNNQFEKLSEISNVFIKSFNFISKSCDEICNFMGNLIQSISNPKPVKPLINQIQKENTFTSDLLLKSKINRLSINPKISFLMPIQSSNVNHFMNLLRKMTISEYNIKTGHNREQSLFSNGLTFQEERPSWISSPERNKDWNFGLGSRNTLGKISLPGTVYWDGDRRSLMGSWKREKEISERRSGLEHRATER